MRLREFLSIQEKELKTPKLHTGDLIVPDRDGLERSKIDGIKHDRRGQPVLKTSRGDKKLFTFDIPKYYTKPFKESSDSPQSIPAEIAALLKTNEKNLPARMARLQIGPTCPRCGGSGNYSYNSMHGTMCYGCRGVGVNLPKTKQQWIDALEQAKQVVQSGRLDQYLAYLRAASLSKNALDRMMAAWKPTEVAKRYGQIWRELDKAPDGELVRALNNRMHDAYERVEKLSMKLTGAKGEELEKGTMELAKAVEEGLAEIAAAEAEYQSKKI